MVNMVRAVSHGGHCCGLFHIHGFTNPGRPISSETEERLQIGIKNAIGLYCVTGNNNRLAEIVLTDSQCGYGGGVYPRILRKMGFTLVQRFRNSNSGNICNVFHKINKSLSLDPKDLPFEWGPPVTPAETFHRINRSGESPLVFESLEAARLKSSPSRLVKIIKRVSGQPDQVVWSINPMAPNPFK